MIADVASFAYQPLGSIHDIVMAHIENERLKAAQRAVAENVFRSHHEYRKRLLAEQMKYCFGIESDAT